MVKPGLPYLDIISEARTICPNHPLAVYQVSGEYAMIVAGANAGVYDLKTMAFESMECFLRAGEHFSLVLLLSSGFFISYSPTGFLINPMCFPFLS